MPSENFQIRDVFNPQSVTALSQRLKAAWPAFEADKFCKKIIPKLPEQTYSERWKHISLVLEEHLPKAYPEAIEILLAAQLPPYGGDKLEGSNGRFITVALTAFVSRNGMGHFDLSMHALYEMTKRLTAEFDIRHFLKKFPEKTLAVLTAWASDPNPHVRRLVSEGSRPILPWGMRLQQFVDDPTPTLRLLHLLRNDPSEYVRRSVANHLNDHSKNHPDLVVKTLQDWQAEFPGKNMQRLVRHATRTLVKKGHAGALELLGFKRGAAVRVENLEVTPSLSIGEYQSFSFDIVSEGKSTQPLAIDYVIYFQKSNGTLAPKVFKLTTRQVGAGEKISLKKRHSFRVITTRKYYPGEHALAIQVNGEEKAKAGFTLKPKKKNW